ncbi:hypothetical protein M0D21_00955 [Aquimarina sp. D1M17]|uniref:hypothetical protein n=1 Tax=Aquimarina acroporae TaxID=2937283 RepID=UPI0020BE6CE2|nr:hypothetical protein [Aquimarina acroporae]MCK8520119.1 hypothetical protein [Aquimarina acroporae]
MTSKITNSTFSKKKYSILIALLLFEMTLVAQINHVTFEIPKQNKNVSLYANNCDSCNAALNPELKEKIQFYKESNLRDWLYQYFKSNEEQRRIMKREASSNLNLNAVVKSIPIKFGYNSNQSSNYNYWNKKYIEWTNTRLISIDDVVYLFKENSQDQLQAWLECKKVSCSFSAAVYADKSIFLDIKKIRNDTYDITLTNLSLANIKITEIQVDETLEKISGRKFKINGKVSNKGGSVNASYKSKSTLDVNFSIAVSYDILGTNDEDTTIASYIVKPELPEVPVGTVIASVMSYEQFLRINQIENLSSSEQIWLPCDGRSVPNAIFISKTPDLRGVFIRGANIMDKNQSLHTDLVQDQQKNPDNVAIGELQLDSFKKHSHNYSRDLYSHRAGTGRNNNNVPRSQDGENQSNRITTETGGSETRPKNITVIYLIKVR